MLGGMRCASCNSVLDPALVALGSVLRCACGAELDLGGASSRPSSTSRVAAFKPSLELSSVPASPSGAPCPRCEVPLEARETFYECASCGGAFVDRDMLAAVRARAVTPTQTEDTVLQPRAARETSSYVKCPRCREIMDRTVFGRRSGIVIDACPRHGSWFDHGELTRAVEFVARGGLDDVARHEIEEAREKRRDPKVVRAAAEADAALIAEAVADGRRMGSWGGRLQGGGGLLGLLRILME